MTDSHRTVVAIFGLLIMISVVLLLAGCASTPKGGLEQPSGNLHVRSGCHGPGTADRSTKMGEGTTVADWFQRGSGGGMSFGVGTGISTGNVGVYRGPTVSSAERFRVLRLTFGPAGKLAGFRTLSQ